MKNKVEGPINAQVKPYHNSIVIKTDQYYHMIKTSDTIDRPEIKLYIYNQLSFGKSFQDEEIVLTASVMINEYPYLSKLKTVFQRTLLQK